MTFARFLAVLFALATFVGASPHCNTFSQCDACTSVSTWNPFGTCYWCPKDGQCHVELSAFNPCSSSESVSDIDQCTGPKPIPPPARPLHTNNTKYVKEIMDALLWALQIKDINTSACVSDFGDAALNIKYFATDFKSKQFSAATMDISRGFSALSRSVTNCKIPELVHKLDAFAVSTGFANITANVDKAAKIMVDASDLWNELEGVATAVESNDPDKVGTSIGALLAGWTSVTGGCGDDELCHLVDGLLKVFQVGAQDAKPCMTALAPAYNGFKQAGDLFEKAEYKNATSVTADALLMLSNSLRMDSCGLKSLADTIGGLSAPLRTAVVTVEGSKIIRITVGSADVYRAMYALSADIKKGDYSGVGVQLGVLLTQLRAASCQTKSCMIVEGLLASLQVGFDDTTKCVASMDTEWGGLENFLRALEMKDWAVGMQKLSDVMTGVNSALNSCGVYEISSILANTSKSLGYDAVASDIGAATTSLKLLMTAGKDITSDFNKMFIDYQNGHWDQIGKDLGVLSTFITTHATCNSVVCRVVEGLLEEADLSLENLKPCESTLRTSETSFVAGATLWSQGMKLNAVKSWASGLNDVAQAVGDCGLAQKLGWIQQEAGVMGLANLTKLQDVSLILVHGSDFYELLFSALQNLESGDFRSLGSKMGILMNNLSTWTTGHLCTSPVCYVVNGITQYLAELSGGIGQCKGDFASAWKNFGDGFRHLSGHPSIFSSWNNNTFDLKLGVGDIGHGLKAVAAAVSDCHLEGLVKILEALGEKLALPAVVGEVDAFLHIVIDGVDIETGLADACIAFGKGDWAGFGYNVVKLIESFVESPARTMNATEIFV